MGMTDRWIYYLEHDGNKFMHQLRTAPHINMNNGKLTGPVVDFPEEFDFTRGDENNKIFGFRVVLRKAHTDKLTPDMFMSPYEIRVCLNDDHKIDYVEVPNMCNTTKKFTVTRLEKYNAENNTIRLVTKRKGLFHAQDRLLYLNDGADEGKKFLKFLLERGVECDEATSDALKEQKVIQSINWCPDFRQHERDWPLLEDLELESFKKGDRVEGYYRGRWCSGTFSGPSRSQPNFYTIIYDHERCETCDARKDEAHRPKFFCRGKKHVWCQTGARERARKEDTRKPTRFRRRLVEAGYYSLIGFNVMLMCCLVAGICSVYYQVGSESNQPPRW